MTIDQNQKRLHSLRLSLANLKECLGSQPQLHSFNQVDAFTLTRLVASLPAGKYGDIELVYSSWGIGAGGRYSVDIICRGAEVATVDVFKEAVKWHTWNLYMHLYIMNVLGQARKSIREQERLELEQRQQARIDERVEKDVALIEVAGSFTVH